jgi:uncharacterized membrane protein
MNRLNGTTILVAILILLLSFGAGFLSMRGWGMMGTGMMGGTWLIWLIPMAIVVLVLAGVVWLVQTLRAGSNPPGTDKTCPACGRGVQADWQNCPYCGRELP